MSELDNWEVYRMAANNNAPNHMRIWEQVQETEPGYTKAAELDGRIVTAINPTYMARRATELFGPIGTGWGYKVLEERFDQGVPIFRKDQGKDTGEVICHEVMHTILLELWYLDDKGEQRFVSHYGHTPYIRGTRYGAKTDFDAPKKTMTDAMKKCLSMLGFSADIFLGLYDDEDYVEGVKAREAIKRADEADEEIIRQREQFAEWASKEIRAYQAIPNARSLKLVHEGHLKKAQRQCTVLNLDYDKIKPRFVQAYEERLDEMRTLPKENAR